MARKKIALIGSGQIGGTLVAAMKGGGLYLTRMAVRPDWQKRGVGRALLAAAGVQARALGA
ncbi:MAG TPA: GNAT family N-acetyltransferase, partial [Devosia sp.]|nr:GNAT family N-acetyltransferase [Devosia sp.]